jgi:hypothetical protein
VTVADGGVVAFTAHIFPLLPTFFPRLRLSLTSLEIDYDSDNYGFKGWIRNAFAYMDRSRGSTQA